MRFIKKYMLIILLINAFGLGCAGGFTSIDNKDDYKKFTQQMNYISASINSLDAEKMVIRSLKDINVYIEGLRLSPNELEQAFNALLTNDQQALKKIGQHNIFKLKSLQRKIIELIEIPNTMLQQSRNILADLNKRKELLLKIVVAIEGKALLASRAPILGAQEKAIIKRRAVEARSSIQTVIKQVSDIPKRLASTGPQVAREVQQAIFSLKRLGVDAYSIAKGLSKTKSGIASSHERTSTSDIGHKSEKNHEIEEVKSVSSPSETYSTEIPPTKTYSTETSSTSNQTMNLRDKLDDLEAEIKRKKDHTSQVEMDWARVQDLIKEDREIGKKAILLFFEQYDQHPLGNPVQSLMERTAKNLGLELKSKSKSYR